jgi:hypothetical protein
MCREDAEMSDVEGKCARCVQIHQAYPNESWTQFCEMASNTKRRGQIAVARRILDAQPKPLVMETGSVSDEIIVATWCKKKWDVYNEKEFRAFKNVSLGAVNFKPNANIVNEEGVDEEVFLVAADMPRRLTVVCASGVRFFTEYGRHSASRRAA